MDIANSHEVVAAAEVPFYACCMAIPIDSSLLLCSCRKRHSLVIGYPQILAGANQSCGPAASVVAVAVAVAVAVDSHRLSLFVMIIMDQIRYSHSSYSFGNVVDAKSHVFDVSLPNLNTI